MKNKIFSISVLILGVIFCCCFMSNSDQKKQEIAESDNEVALAADVETVEVSIGSLPEEERLAEEKMEVSVVAAEPISEEGTDLGSVDCVDEYLTLQREALLEEQRLENLIMDEVVPVEQLTEGHEVDHFFDDAIFVGDSITVGLSNYYDTQRGKVFADSTQFLARVGCAAKMCVSQNPLSTYATYMPYNNGSLTLVEDGVAASGAKKVFIDYGLNDLVGSTPQQYMDNLVTLIGRIKEKSPDVDIYIISTTYVVDGAENGTLTNANIRKSNENVKNYCAEYGYGYIDIADYLADSNGCLNSNNSSDQYVHQNSKAYSIWVKVLRHYASKQIIVS